MGELDEARGFITQGNGHPINCVYIYKLDTIDAMQSTLHGPPATAKSPAPSGPRFPVILTGDASLAW